MKKIVAFAGASALALSLAACGGSDVDEPTEAEIDTADTVIPETSAGTYTGTTEDGTEWSSTLNADGTFEDYEGGELVRTGTWEDNIRGTCFVNDGEEGEECYNIGEVQADGTIEVTGPDGETFTMTKAD